MGVVALESWVATIICASAGRGGYGILAAKWSQEVGLLPAPLGRSPAVVAPRIWRIGDCFWSWAPVSLVADDPEARGTFDEICVKSVLPFLCTSTHSATKHCTSCRLLNKTSLLELFYISLSGYWGCAFQRCCYFRVHLVNLV